jgi:adenosine deaminase
VLRCATERIGHGVEVFEDCVVEGGRIVELGAVASAVRDRRIPLELCPTSNLHTKGWTADNHPIGMLHRAGFAVTINTDNRLMSRTSMTDEFELVRAHHGFTVDDLATVTRTALDAAFCSYAERRRLWEDRIAPAYRAAGAELTPLFL